MVRLGTSSFSENDWVGPFYPPGSQPKDFLRLYAGHFDTVEIDATYYAIPSRSTVDGWYDKTPDGFLFCAKFPRSIVHGGSGARPDPNVVLVPDKTYPERDKFLEVLRRLGNRLGPLLIQFPYFAKELFPAPELFYSRLERFLDDLPKDLRFVVEVRNRGWLKKPLIEMLRRRNIALALVDHAWMPMADELMRKFDPITAEFAYVRLLGDRKAIEAISTKWDKEVLDHTPKLERWADFLVEMDRRDVDTLLYVNNHYAGHAPTTVRRLKELYEKRLGLKVKV